MSTPNEPKETNEPKPEKVVIPDECGDSLWDEVLAQHPDLTSIISKPPIQKEQ